MPYNPSTGIISPAVSIYDVQRCFGLSSPDLATLILNANINMWSQIKPIYSTKIAQLTTADRSNPRTISGFKTGAGIKKWAGVYADYIVGKDINTGSVASHVWQLDRPVVDGLCAFRLTDFAGYYHFVGNVMRIYTLFGNINNIVTPSASGQQGTNIAFSFGFTNPIADGSIHPNVLFGDCIDYYPAVILTNGASGSNSYQYAKAAPSPISAYTTSPVTININTADFAAAIANDFQQLHSGDPYQNYPLRTGDNWTACVVLVSTAPFENTHVIPSGATIVRLEYESGVDRRTLPIKQSKYNNIEWMKMTVKIVKVSGGDRKYKLDSVVVTAKMLNTSSVTFAINANPLSTPQGTVACGTTTGQSIVVNNFSSVTFSGTTGEVTKNLSFAETTWNVTATTAGNQLVNGRLVFHHSNGDFNGGFSFDVSTQDPEYTISDIQLL